MGSTGYKWMTNNINTKCVHPNNIDEYIALGWIFGTDNDYKQKISDALKGKAVGKCLDPIKELERKRKISNSMKGNTNWMYNKKRGNGKKGSYKGFKCDSTWELAFIVYHIEHNLNIKPCNIVYEYIYEGEIHKYYPDFITDDGIIEIKGRKNKKALVKEQQYPNVIIIDANKIKRYLDYVIQKYGEKFWKVLYEDIPNNKLSKKHITKQKIKNDKRVYNKNAIIDLEQNSNIDFSKFGWVEKAKKYLQRKNINITNLSRFIKCYYPEFFVNNNVFKRKHK